MQIFHNPRCSKSRETLNIIIENNIKHNINLYEYDFEHHDIVPYEFMWFLGLNICSFYSMSWHNVMM